MKGKKVILVGLVVTAGYFAYAFVGRDGRCPVELPPNYTLLAYDEGKASLDMALHMQVMATRPSFQVGTTPYWLFESKGPVEESSASLLAFLRAQGAWRPINKLAFKAHSDNSKSPTVVMMPLKYKDGTPNPTRHLVRVYGLWRNPGPYENLLSHLPKRLLESWARERSLQPTQSP